MLRVAALLCLAVPVSAEEYTDLNVSNFVIGETMVTIHLPDTVADQPIICAVYDSAGQLIASRRSYTNSLATTVRVPYKIGAPNNVRCVHGH